MYTIYSVNAAPAPPANEQPFDPFAILELDSSASDKDIRKAHRKLSLKYHPDKNPDDEAAAEQYVQIKKAYEALTNELSRANFEKYVRLWLCAHLHIARRSPRTV